MAAEAGVSLPLTTEAARLWAESAAALGDAEDFTRMGAFKDTDETPALKVASHG